MTPLSDRKGCCTSASPPFIRQGASPPCADPVAVRSLADVARDPGEIPTSAARSFMPRSAEVHAERRTVSNPTLEAQVTEGPSARG